MQNIKKILAGFIAVAIMGAGCGDTKDDNAMISDTGTVPVSTPSEVPVTSTSAMVTELNLSKAEGVGDSIVEIEFSAPESVTKEATGYQLLLSKDPNPTKENAGDWYVLGPAHRTKLWKVAAKGERYVSVCALKGDTCLATSAAVKVDVK